MSVFDDFYFCPQPTVTITLSQYLFNFGDTGTITFTFSRVPVGFDIEDISVENGILSGLIQTSNPLIYQGLFTPTPNIHDTTNIVIVGKNWKDVMDKSPAEKAYSYNYEVNTIAHDYRITTDGDIRMTMDGDRRIVAL